MSIQLLTDSSLSRRNFKKIINYDKTIYSNNKTRPN